LIGCAVAGAAALGCDGALNMTPAKGDPVRACRLVFVACVLALTFSSGLFASPSAAGPAPRLGNPTAAAKPLVLRFFVLLAHKDRAGLRRFLSPAFQVQRADDSASGKAQYLANLPTVHKFYISTR